MEYDDGDDGGSGDDASFMKGFLSLSHTHTSLCNGNDDTFGSFGLAGREAWHVYLPFYKFQV